jgi:hypothetical protein
VCVCMYATYACIRYAYADPGTAGVGMHNFRDRLTYLKIFTKKFVITSRHVCRHADVHTRKCTLTRMHTQESRSYHCTEGGIRHSAHHPTGKTKQPDMRLIKQEFSQSFGRR